MSEPFARQVVVATVFTVTARTIMSIRSFRRILVRFMNGNDRWKWAGIFPTGTATCRPEGFLQRIFLCSCVDSD